ncbi:MAG: restriction endonuclease subunit S [Peptococcaceae bacterium]
MTPQELKNSILQRAIQGKLVEQRPEEGNAEELYQQIQAEKQRLITEGKIKKEKPLPEITEDEIPFEIPESWKWVRLGSVLRKLGAGSTPTGGKAVYVSSGVKFIRSQNVYNDGLRLADIAYITEEVNNKKSGSIVQAKDILLNITGGSIGRCALVSDDFDIANINQHVMIIRTIDSDIRYWLHSVLISPYVQTLIMAVQVGVSREGLSATKLSNFLVPLPPLAEQKRIVAKIEELLPYIDRYEQAWSRLEEFNKRFPVDMQKSILQRAIQGKLVEQRPEEGTGEELYQQIQEEKQRLLAKGKIKKEKPLPEIIEDEIPFEIPDSWKWVRLNDVVHGIEAGKSFKCNETPPKDGECGIIKVSAVTWGTFRECESKTCYSNQDWVPEYEIKPGDFLMTRANTKQLVGACVIVEAISKKLMLSDKTLRIHFSGSIYNRFLLWCIRSAIIRTQIESAATGTSDSMKNISQKLIQSLILPLPPLAEQKRIVARLEELLPLCERLK